MKNKIFKMFIFILLIITISACGKKKQVDFEVSVLETTKFLESANEAEAAKIIKNNIVRITNEINESTKIVGTGFFIKEGYLLTNSHIVDIEGKITIEYSDGTKEPAFLYSNSIEDDIALLKVEDIKVKALPFSESDTMEVTNDVLGAGFIYNFAGEASVSKGILSARRNTELLNYLQSDISIDSGASGGPLFNAKAGVIGVNTFVTENRTFALTLSSESTQLIIDILLDEPIVNYLTTTRPSNAINSILVEIGYTEDNSLELYNDSNIIKLINNNVKDDDKKENNTNNDSKVEYEYYCEDGSKLYRNKCIKQETYSPKKDSKECKSGYTKVDEFTCKKTTIVEAKANYSCSDGRLTEDKKCVTETIEVGGESKEERWGSCPKGKKCYDLGANHFTNTLNPKFVTEMVCPSDSTKITYGTKFVWNGEKVESQNFKNWSTKLPGATQKKDEDGTVYYQDVDSVLAMCSKEYNSEENVHTFYTYNELKNIACPNGGTLTANTNNQGFYCLVSTTIHRFAWNPVCSDSIHSWIEYNGTYYCGRIVEQYNPVQPYYTCDKGVIQDGTNKCLVDDIYTLNLDVYCENGDSLQGGVCIKNIITDAKRR